MGKKGGVKQSQDWLHADKDYANWKNLAITAAGEPLPNDTTELMETDDQNKGTKRVISEVSGKKAVQPVVDKAPRTMNDGSGDGDEPMAIEAARVGGGMNGPSKETPISNYPTLNYGLQETHTTILPLRMYAGVKCTNYQVGQRIELRMNAIYDCLKSTLAEITGTTAVTNTLADGVYADKLSNGALLQVGTATKRVTFPNRHPAGDYATERPQWRDYWAQLYEYYTVLGCKWKVTVANAATASYLDMDIAYEYDSYSNATGATGNVMPNAPYMEMVAFKGVKWARVSPANSEPNNYVTVIEGHYKPGMIKRNIINDGDVKTWTKISDQHPSLTETLVMVFWPSDLTNYNLRPAGDNTITSNTGCNVRIELDYIVQFKDLKLQARYPNSVSAAEQNISQNIAIDNAKDNTRLWPVAASGTFAL